ncbi:MAG: hypothetical protein KGJ86_15925, partial [Chloroflexota bacterium]|nr:hypothetical protein [Chloroflexota bacterium]
RRNSAADDSGPVGRPAMKVPKEPEPEELARLLDTLEARIQLRAYEDNVDSAYQVLGRVQAEIEGILSSQSMYRDWRERRPALLDLVAELDRVLL